MALNNLMDIGSYIQQGFKDGEARGTQTRIGQLMGLAQGATPDVQRGLLQQAYATDADAGRKMQTALDGDRDAATKRLAQKAGMVAKIHKANPQMAGGMYAGLAQEAAQLFPDMQFSPQLDDATAGLLEQFAGAYGGATAKELPTSVQEYQFAQGNPGYADYRERIAQASARPQYGNINGTPIQYGPDGFTPVQQAGGQQQPPMGQQPPQVGPTGGAASLLHSAVAGVESNNDPRAVSPKGALGTMQTMPGTLTDPGYGVQPARDDSDAERTRVGQDYVNAMVAKYGPEGGLAAYNWGPGNWEAALSQAGGDPRRALQLAPAETQAYVPKVLAQMGGGQSQQGGQSSILTQAQPPITASAKVKAAWPFLSPEQRQQMIQQDAGLVQDPKPQMLADAEVAQEGFPKGTKAYRDKDGIVKTTYTPPAAKSDAPKELTGELKLKLALFENAKRSAGEWHKLVTGPNGEFNDSASRMPKAMALLRAAIGNKLRAESGAAISAEEISNETRRYLGGMLSADGTNNAQAQMLLDDLDHQIGSLSGGPSGGGQRAPDVTTKAQYDALPSGTVYMEDGKQYRKP